MNSKPDIWKWIAPLALLLLAPACGHDDLVPPDVFVEEKTPYVEIRISMPAGVSYVTRANPMGGEEGNGREEGILKEDKIHDINIFFYIEEKGKGMNSKAATPIINHIFYNLDNRNDSRNTKLWSGNSNLNTGDAVPYFDKNYLVLKYECSAEERQQIESTGISFLVIANVDLMQDVQTIGDLRNIDLGLDGTNNWINNYDAYSVNAAKMDYFLMSTAYSDDYSYNGQSTGKNRIEKDGDDYLGITTLQRMYARIDLWYNEEDNAMTEKNGDTEVVEQLKYSVKEADGNTVYLTNVLPVNIMQKPSYIFKRVTDFGEGFDDWTTSGFKGKTTFFWGGKENPYDGPFSDTEYKDKPTNYVIERHTTEKTPDGTGGLTSGWYGKTAKEKVITDITDTSNGPVSAYYHGEPNSESDPDYGCDRIAIISYANENTHPIDCYHSNYLTGLAFHAVYVPEKIYTGSHETKNANNETEVVPTEWTEADENPTEIYRYSPTAKAQEEKYSLYFTSKTAADDYAIAHPGDMAIVSPEPFIATQHVEGKDKDGKDIKKWGFICYYNLWLRHYNNEAGDPTENYPMEYATVRNNIYRVAVSFRGPGDPTPTMREPDTMKARIFVRKWNYREEDKLIYD